MTEEIVEMIMGSVYFARVGSEVVKIGFTTNLCVRY